MKKQLLLIYLLCNLLSFAQNFAPVGAIWHYTEGHAFSGNTSFFKIESIQDSLFMGKNCKLLQKNNELDCENRPLHTLVYEEDSVVYFWDESYNEFQILYDLTKEINESWFVKIRAQNQNTDTIVVTVTNFYSTAINSSILKTFDVNYSTIYNTSGVDFSWSSKIIERIGDTTFLFNYHPETVLFCDFNVSNGLRCYEDNLGFYSNGTSASCEYNNLGIADLNTEINLNLCPNPNNGRFEINSNREIDKVFVYNSYGKLISQIPPTKEIDLSNLNAGIYTIQIDLKGEKIVRRIVIE